MTGPCHHRTAADIEDRLFYIHGAFDVIDDSQVLIVCSVLGHLVFVLEQIFCQKSDEPVRVDETARLVHGTDAVAVTVGPQPKFAAVFNDGFAQVEHVFWTGRVGAVVGFAGVPIAV